MTMPDFSAYLTLIKSPRTSFVVFLFCMSILFAPYERVGLKRPALTEEYEIIFVVTLFLSFAVMAMELLVVATRVFKRHFRARKRRQFVETTFLSLNLHELCVLWAMTQASTKTITGSNDSPVMVSLRQKKCLDLIPGPHTYTKMHHYMPDDIYNIVSQRGYEHMPEEFRKSERFDEKVDEIVRSATDWRRW